MIADLFLFFLFRTNTIPGQENLAHVEKTIKIAADGNSNGHLELQIRKTAYDALQSAFGDMYV